MHVAVHNHISGNILYIAVVQILQVLRDGMTVSQFEAPLTVGSFPEVEHRQLLTVSLAANVITRFLILHFRRDGIGRLISLTYVLVRVVFEILIALLVIVC